MILRVGSKQNPPTAVPGVQIGQLGYIDALGPIVVKLKEKAFQGSVAFRPLESPLRRLLHLPWIPTLGHDLLRSTYPTLNQDSVETWSLFTFGTSLVFLNSCTIPSLLSLPPSWKTNK